MVGRARASRLRTPSQCLLNLSYPPLYIVLSPTPTSLSPLVPSISNLLSGPCLNTTTCAEAGFSRPAGLHGRKTHPHVCMGAVMPRPRSDGACARASSLSHHAHTCTRTAYTKHQVISTPRHTTTAQTQGDNRHGHRHERNTHTHTHTHTHTKTNNTLQPFTNELSARSLARQSLLCPPLHNNSGARHIQ